MDLLEIKSMDELERSYREWVEESLGGRDRERKPGWTESIAVGSEVFVEKMKIAHGIKAIGREAMGENGVYELRERDISYNAIMGGENACLRPKNTYLWDISVLFSTTCLIRPNAVVTG